MKTLKLIDKDSLIDDVFLAGQDKNTLTIKEIYTLIQKRAVYIKMED